MFETRTNGRDARHTVQKYYGKYPGIVVAEPELPEEAALRGELRVQVPGLLEETEDGSGQQAIKVIAKPCFHPGFFFIPEVDDQVWIEFAAGDINSPLWTGVWYPDEAPPQTVDGEGPTQAQKIIRTASGHVVQLDDTEDEEKIIIRHKSESQISIDENGHIRFEHADVTIEIKDDDTVEISCGTMTVTADNGMTINADVTVDGTMQVTGDTTVEGVLTVGTGPSTTIDGNKITGG